MLVLVILVILLATLHGEPRVVFFLVGSTAVLADSTFAVVNTVETARTTFPWQHLKDG